MSRCVRSRVIYAGLGMVSLLMVLLASAAWTAPHAGPGAPGMAAGAGD